MNSIGIKPGGLIKEGIGKISLRIGDGCFYVEKWLSCKAIKHFRSKNCVHAVLLWSHRC